ncbi:MAG TPA: sigma-70 family RNA polymerase sigma factor [Acidimicrobiales bacterium]|nr:sigma-70 family RNA polymerase sigma factor [Acidimicrobiales bacterium]
MRSLVEAAREGDASAWEHIYVCLYPRLLSYARRELDLETARDAVSEAMLRAAGALPRFSWKGAGFEAWLFRILRHVLVDTHRGTGRRRRLEATAPKELDHPEADDALIADEEARLVRRAFARLAPADQELLHLRVVAGLSADEVGHILGKRPGAVRMAQSRSLERLRAALVEEGSWS